MKAIPDRASPSALTFARLLGEGPLAKVALEAALLLLEPPAFIASASGTVLFKNAEGEKKLLLSRDRMRSQLANAIAGLGDPSAEAHALVTPLRCEGKPTYYLVVFRPPASPAEDVSHAAGLWELTKRQGEVLEMLAEGFANKTIAARLGCAERTVETHLSAIFQKSGYDLSLIHISEPTRPY